MKKNLRMLLVAAIAAVMVFQGTAFLNGVTYGEPTPTDDPNYVDGQFVIVLNDDVEMEAVEDIVAFAVSEELISKGRDSKASSASNVKKDIELTKIKSNNNIVLAEVDIDVDEEAVAKQMRNNPDVEIAQPNYCYSSLDSNEKSDTNYGDQWYLDYIDAPEAWELIDQYKENGGVDTESPQIVIASLDSGVLWDHEDLNNNIDNSLKDDNDVTPLDGHGTKMAGIIGATADNGVGIAGVAAGNENDIIRLLPIDVFKNKGNNEQVYATTADIVTGMDYACNHDARIINMCFGRYGKDDVLEQKLNWAAEEGALLIASAGNNGNEEAWYPADYETCVSCINSVKYEDAASELCRNEASSYGEGKDISAPGTDILTTNMDGTYTSETGTSYSAAIVSATAAMVIFIDPELTAQEVKDILFETTEDLYTEGYDIYTGYGNVNAYRAVSKALDGWNKKQAEAQEADNE